MARVKAELEESATRDLPPQRKTRLSTAAQRRIQKLLKIIGWLVQRRKR